MKVKETTTLKKQNFVRSFKLTDEIPIGQIQSNSVKNRWWWVWPAEKEHERWKREGEMKKYEALILNCKPCFLDLELGFEWERREMEGEVLLVFVRTQKFGLELER